MHTLVNIAPDKSTDPNRVELLESLNKSKILTYVLLSQIQPHKYTIAVACDLDEMQPDLTPARDLVTLSEWLLEKGIDLDNSAKHRMALLVASIYKKEYQRAPRLIARPNGNKWQNKSYAFHHDELHILDQALSKLKKNTVVVHNS